MDRRRRGRNRGPPRAGAGQAERSPGRATRVACLDPARWQALGAADLRDQGRGPRSRGAVGARRSRRLLTLRDTARAMSQENVEIVRAVDEAWNAGNMGALRELLDPDVILRLPAEWPESGPFVGR